MVSSYTALICQPMRGNKLLGQFSDHSHIGTKNFAHITHTGGPSGTHPRFQGLAILKTTDPHKKSGLGPRENADLVHAKKNMLEGTHKQTDRHCNYQTESAQWANWVKRGHTLALVLHQGSSKTSLSLGQVITQVTAIPF